MSWPPFSTQTTTRKTHLSWCHQVTEEEQKVPAELLWPQKSMAYIWMTGWTIAKVTDCRHFSEAIEISHLSLSLSFHVRRDLCIQYRCQFLLARDFVSCKLLMQN